MTHAPSHSTSTGQTREQLNPRTLDSRIVNAEPNRFPLEIFLMKRGTSIWVGHAPAQGASKQYRQRFASTTASCGRNAGCSSGNLSAMEPMLYAFTSGSYMSGRRSRKNCH